MVMDPDNILDPSTPIEAVDAELQALGYTPEDIAAFGRQTRALVRVCLENRAMREKLERVELLPAKWRETKKGSGGWTTRERDVYIAELEAALKDPP